MIFQEVDEENPEHVVLTSGPRVRRTINDNSEEENEIDNNVNNTTAAIERLGHIITSATEDFDNANHDIQIPPRKNILEKQQKEQKQLKSSFEDFSRNFVGYKGNKNNPSNKGLSSAGPVHQLDNMPRIGEATVILGSVSEGNFDKSDSPKFLNMLNFFFTFQRF